MSSIQVLTAAAVRSIAPRVPVTPNDGIGDFAHEGVLQEGSDYDVLRNKASTVLAHIASSLAEARRVGILHYLLEPVGGFPALNGGDPSEFQRIVSNRVDSDPLRYLGSRGLSAVLEECYPTHRIRARKTSNGFRVSLNAHGSIRLSNMLWKLESAAETSVSPFGNPRSTHLGEFYVQLLTGRVVPGLNATLSEFGFSVPTSKLKAGDLPLTSDSFSLGKNGGTWGFANPSIDLFIDNPRANDPIEVVNTTTWQRDTYSDFNAIPDLKGKVVWLKTLSSSCNVQTYYSFDISREMAEYITQTDFSKISPASVGQWFSGLLSRGKNLRPAPSMYTPIDVVKQRLQEVNGSQSAAPRTGLLGLMIKPSTLALHYIPQEELDEQRQAAEASQVSQDVYDSRQANSLVSGVALCNWSANVLAIREGADLQVLDLTDWVAATPYHIRRFLEADRANFDPKSARGIFLERCVDIVRKANLSNASLLDADKRLDGFPAVVRSWAKSVLKGDTHTLMYLLDKTRRTESAKRVFPLTDFNEDSPSGVMQWLAGEIIAKAVDHSLKVSEGELAKLLGLSLENILRWKAIALIWNAYCRKSVGHAVLLQQDKEARANYGKQPEDQDELPDGFTPDAVPNVSNSLMLMPHQAKAAYSLQKNPKFAILQVDAGGGKTMMIILDILRKLKDGLVSTPAVYSPSHLLGNYVQDACFGTAGKVNIVPISTATVSQHGKEFFENIAVNKPLNTVFVISYDFVSLDKGQTLCIGNHTIDVPGNAQWLRSLGIDGAWLDESQYLKNDSNRTNAVRQAIVDVKYRVLATGTFLQTRLTDVIEQMMLLDAGIFGTTSRFLQEHGDDFNSATVEDFETGEQLRLSQFVARAVENHSCVVKGSRKEWASLLPPRKVSFHWVELTETQRAVYNSIVDATIDAILKDPKAVALLNAQDDTKDDALASIVNRYLQRIERFLTAPSSDEISAVLDEADKVSPKGAVVTQIIKDHISQGIPGKILIFTSYVYSAEEVFRALPPEIQDMTILYRAEDKMRCRAQFEADPKKQVMIGCEWSMNTGINAQFASRLIRLESVYSQGILEQGESRINRPNIKKLETRTGIYMDWVLVDKTIDVTKTGRLISRRLSTSKFNNADNPKYQDLPDLPPLRMNIPSIRASNSFNDSLNEYMSAYMQLENEVIAGEVEEYRAKHPTLNFYKQGSAGLLPNSKVIVDVPYVPGGSVFNQDELGLSPLQDTLNSIPDTVDVTATLRGMPVHTSSGDGTVVSVSKSRVQVRIVGGAKLSFDHGEVFLINKASTNATETRNAMLRDIGLDGITSTGVAPYIPKGTTGLDTKDQLRKRRSGSTNNAPANENPALVDAPIDNAIKQAIVQDVPQPVAPASQDSDDDLVLPEPPVQEDVLPTVAVGYLVLQVRRSLEGLVWEDYAKIKDSQRGLPFDQQYKKYSDYAYKRLAAYCADHNLEPDDCDARLVDAHSRILFSTDGLDDWIAISAEPPPTFDLTYVPSGMDRQVVREGNVFSAGEQKLTLTSPTTCEMADESGNKKPIQTKRGVSAHARSVMEGWAERLEEYQNGEYTYAEMLELKTEYEDYVALLHVAKDFYEGKVTYEDGSQKLPPLVTPSVKTAPQKDIKPYLTALKPLMGNTRYPGAALFNDGGTMALFATDGVACVSINDPGYSTGDASQAYYKAATSEPSAISQYGLDRDEVLGFLRNALSSRQGSITVGLDRIRELVNTTPAPRDIHLDMGEANATYDYAALKRALAAFEALSPSEVVVNMSAGEGVLLTLEATLSDGVSVTMAMQSRTPQRGWMPAPSLKFIEPVSPSKVDADPRILDYLMRLKPVMNHVKYYGAYAMPSPEGGLRLFATNGNIVAMIQNKAVGVSKEVWYADSTGVVATDSPKYPARRAADTYFSVPFNESAAVGVMLKSLSAGIKAVPTDYARIRVNETSLVFSTKVLRKFVQMMSKLRNATAIINLMPAETVGNPNLPSGSLAIVDHVSPNTDMSFVIACVQSGFSADNTTEVALGVVTDPVVPVGDPDKVKPEPVAEDKHDHPVPTAVDGNGIDLWAGFYNDFFGAMINSEDVDLETLGCNPADYGFQRHQATAYLRFSRWQQLDSFHQKMKASGFVLPDGFDDDIAYLKTAIKTGATHADRFKHITKTNADVRAFMLAGRKMVKPDEVAFSFLVLDGDVFAVFDTARMPGWSRLKGMIRIAGAPVETDDPHWLFLAARRTELVSVVKRLQADFGIADFEGVKSVLLEMKDNSRKRSE